MDISITAVTRNRKFTKSLVRYADALEALKRLTIGINTSALPFDVLQLVFLDRSQDYMRAVGCKSDRLFQVEVPIPHEEAVDFGNTSAFVNSIAQQLNRAIKICGLPKDIELQISEAIRLNYTQQP
jgi:hypothetical protein